MTTAGERLLKRQLRKAATIGGGVDTQHLCDMVVAAYEEHDQARRRTEQSAGVMAAEVEEANEALERSVGQLRAQNVRFSLALDNMGNGLALFDKDGRVVVFNRRAGELLGLAGSRSMENLSYEAFVRASPLLDEAAIQARLDLVAAQVDAQIEQVMLDGRQVHVSIQRTADGGFLVNSEDVTERNASASRIAFLAYHDTLTDLPNRRKFAECLDGAASHGRYAVLCVDLDGFKPVNDVFGHAAGDKLLRQVAARMKRHIRPGDTLARLGGDEFAIILSSDASEAEGIAARITQEVGVPFDLDGTIVHIGASVGIAIVPDDAETAEDAMRNADLALYRAKETGRGRFVRFDPAMNASERARRVLKQDLSLALLRSQFEVYYQPRVHAESGEIASFEALIRWHHPTRGMVPPSEFIPLAEQTGAIVEIGHWVLRPACQEALRWPNDVGIAVNVSSIQIRKKLLFDQVMSALTETGLRPGRLELEITETALLSDSVEALAVMRRVQAVGVRVAMDDFGTGYSSLSYLHSFPFDRVKIDQRFVRGLGRDRKALAIVRSVISLCSGLYIGVTAEGVETPAQRQILVVEGCGELQGFLFGSPVSAPDAMLMIDRAATLSTLAAQPVHHMAERHGVGVERPQHSDIVAIERRRPGRGRDISTNLLPLLRSDTGGDTVQPPSRAALIEPETSDRKRNACGACRKPRAIPALSMAFQPIVDLQEHRIDAYEALVRGVNGEIAAEMLKFASGDNLYAFDQACRVKAIELAAGLGLDRTLNINFLPLAVYEPRACIRATLDAARRTGFDPRRLTFEIVETEEIPDTDHLTNIIKEYQKMGFKVAMDDFGAGHSSLARLAALRPDIIKVDRCLIRDCDLDHIQLAIVASIIALGAQIDVKVVVEGVERLGEVEALKSVGARFMQGFYFAKPAFERLVGETEIDGLRSEIRSTCYTGLLTR